MTHEDDIVGHIEMIVMSKFAHSWGACEFVIFSEREMTREDDIVGHIQMIVISKFSHSWGACRFVKLVRERWLTRSSRHHSHPSHLSLTKYHELACPSSSRHHSHLNITNSIISTPPTLDTANLIISEYHELSCTSEVCHVDFTIIGMSRTRMHLRSESSRHHSHCGISRTRSSKHHQRYHLYLLNMGCLWLVGSLKL